MPARPGSGWADIVELDQANWQFTVGYQQAAGNQSVIYERRSNISTSHNAGAAMESAFTRMLASVPGLSD